MKRVGEFIAAATLLTRLPLIGLMRGRSWPDEAASVWAYPIIGALIGLIAGIVLWTAEQCGSPTIVAAILGIVAMIMISGGLHEDGLADTADGFGGGSSVARKLEIMRDSRIGSFGALALIIAFALRTASIASMSPLHSLEALVAAGALGRGAIVVVLLLLKPVRTDGAAASLRDIQPVTAAFAMVFASAASGVLPAHAALPCLAGAGLAGVGSAAIARRQVGGYSGDILGATEIICECAVLCIVASVIP